MLPIIEKETAITLRPDMFPPKDFKDPCVIFFDEISSAPPAVQAAAYQVILDRRAGVHELPKHAYFFAAGNRESDRGMVYKLPSPLANRMFHVELQPDIVSWRQWAFKSGVEISRFMLSPLWPLLWRNRRSLQVIAQSIS